MNQNKSSALRIRHLHFAIAAAMAVTSAAAGAATVDTVRVQVAYTADAQPSKAAAPLPLSVGPALMSLPRDGKLVTYTDTRRTSYTASCGAASSVAADTGFTAQLKVVGDLNNEVLVEADFNLTELERLDPMTVGKCYFETPVISGRRVSGTYRLPLNGEAVLIPLAGGAHIGIRVAHE